MDLVTTIAGARARRKADRAAGRSVVLVPTMGFLHEGHLSLVRRAHELAASVWVSIFVNPAQFGPGEDLDRYPRDLERDLRLLEEERADVVFAPSAEEMYPSPQKVTIGYSGLEDVLCGASRPGHFAGVGLVVSKLFNIVEPDAAVFGQKDAQQAFLIRRLVEDLSFPVRIDVAPIVREADGLAMSSRNTYLSDDERRAAPVLYRALLAARDAIRQGERDPRAVEEILRQVITREPLANLEYAACVGQEDLQPPTRIDRPVLLALAVRLGTTRLIDNMTINPEEI
ncbi:MAG: pantoate--beta-alanine ligase [Acidobacteria bacterium]|nr:pantoate--beta-alanine ligase [Acidobacteriota bacterium]